MKVLLASLVIVSLSCRAMEDVEQVQIVPFDINNPDEFDFKEIANKRSEHLELSYKQSCKQKIKFASKSIQLDDDVLHVLIEKEMATGLGLLQAQLRQKRKKDLLADHKKDDQLQLFSAEDRNDCIANFEDLAPFTPPSFALIDRDYQNALYKRLVKVYSHMRQKPYLLFAMYLWIKEHRKIHYEHALMFSHVLQIWSGNYHQLKKDSGCALL